MRAPGASATPEWLRTHGLTLADARHLYRALCTLADCEGPIKRALREVGDGASDYDHMHVCAALRYLVDGERR